MAIADPRFPTGDKGRLILPAITGDGARDEVSLPTNKWDMTIKGNTRDLSNMRDGRNRQPGLEDADGTFNLPLDVANDPTLLANGGIRHGAIMDAEFHVDDTGDHFYGLKIIIDEISPAVEWGNDGPMIPVKFQLQSGTILYPDYTP